MYLLSRIWTFLEFISYTQEVDSIECLYMGATIHRKGVLYMEAFSVYWDDPNGVTHREVYLETDMDVIKEATFRLTMGPAARMGAIKSVTITDALDRTCFYWVEGVIVHPPVG